MRSTVSGNFSLISPTERSRRGQVRSIVDQLAVEHGRDLVDAVGEQEAAIKHRDLGVRERDE
ncbi:hypothetical protein ACVWZR_004897 [Bradyrhizobium sp. i1.3.1]